MLRWRTTLVSQNSTRLPSIARSFSSSRTCLAGHSKWANIKDQKFSNDAKKSLLYSRAQREISIAIRVGGSPDPELNHHLSTALKRAREQGVPKENIERTLAKATRRGKSSSETLTYEALAFNSVGILIECTSDNVNRTIATIKGILSSHSARMTSVSYLFVKRGVIKIAVDAEGQALDTRVDEITLIGLDSGATDFEPNISGDSAEIEFTCLPENITPLKMALSDPGLKCRILVTDVVFSPLDASEASRDILQGTADLREALESYEDTIRVWTTLDHSL